MKKKTAIRPCPICREENVSVLHNQGFVLAGEIKLPREYDVVSCEHCGFVYADTPSKQKDYDLYYRNLSKYEDSKVATGGGADEYDIKRLERVAKDISSVQQDRNISIIDVGCANGGLLESFRLLGYNNLTGLDPSPQCVSNVRARGIEALVGSIFLLSKGNEVMGDNKYDCVILSHVLEHVRDLKEAASNMVGLMEENGILYVEVPDASSYLDHTSVPYYYFDCEHINHFDESSLRNLFSGLEYVTSGKKENLVSQGHVYPAVYVIFKKARDNSPRRITPSFSVRDKISAYIAMSAAANKWPHIETLAKTQEEIIIWGAGSYTQRLLRNTPLGQCNIKAFVDNDAKKHGQKINGITIYPPVTLKGNKLRIMICSALHSGEIAKEIAEKDYGNEYLEIIN